MNNHNPSSVAVPTFKLAKVGKERKRRGGAAGWFNAGSTASGAGSMGAGAGAGLTKGLLTILISVGVSGGAWQYGKSISGKHSNGGVKAAAPRLFTPKEVAPKYEDTSKVIKAENTIPNSLGYVTESIDGLTPEQRAAAAQAAHQADEEARTKAEVDANKPADAPASASPVDVTAVAAAAGPAAGIQSGKIGKLASSFGSGAGSLSGGSGLSGGISRNFSSGSDLGQRAQNGALSSMRNAARPGLASAPRAAAGNSRSKGFAKRQLDNAFTQSRQAVGSSRGETSATTAAAAFDNNPGAGNVIAGVGTTNSAGPAAAVAADPNGNPLNTGGYSPACKSADYAPDASGTCQLINNPNAKKSAPYQNLIDTAKTLMAIIAALALIAVIFEKSGYPITVAIAKVMKAVIVTLGVILLGLGAAILAQSGDMMMGGIVMAVGAATIATAFWGTEKLTATQQFTQMAVGSLIANSLGALLASSQSASQLE